MAPCQQQRSLHDIFLLLSGERRFETGWVGQVGREVEEGFAIHILLLLTDVWRVVVR